MAGGLLKSCLRGVRSTLHRAAAPSGQQQQPEAQLAQPIRSRSSALRAALSALQLSAYLSYPWPLALYHHLLVTPAELRHRHPPIIC